jgi:hypothetical protein
VLSARPTIPLARIRPAGAIIEVLLNFLKRIKHCLIAVLAPLLIWSQSASAPEEYWRKWNIDSDGNGADGVHTGDFNRDGLVDVVSGWEQSGELKLYLNPGIDRLKLPATWSPIDISGGLAVEGIEDAAFVDLDLDGSIEAVVSSSEGSSRMLAIHWQTGAPSSDPQSWIGTELTADRPSSYMKARAGQIDGVGGADIVAGTKATGDEPSLIYWFKSPPQATAANANSWQRFLVGENDVKTVSLAIRDMDGDKQPDIVYAGRQGVGWFKNPGVVALGTLPAEAYWEKIVITESGSEFTFCKLRPDGGADLIATTSKKSGMLAKWLKRLDASGRRWEEYPISAATSRPDWTSWDKFVLKGVACGFVDADDRIDVVFTASGDGHGVFMMSPAQDMALGQAWDRVNITPSVRGMKFDNLKLTDMDNDGDLDIVTTEEGEGIYSEGEGVLWFENPRTPNQRVGAIAAQ